MLNNAISSTCCISFMSTLVVRSFMQAFFSICMWLPTVYLPRNDYIHTDLATTTAQRHFWKWVYLTWKFLLLNNSVTNNCEIQCFTIFCAWLELTRTTIVQCHMIQVAVVVFWFSFSSLRYIKQMVYEFSCALISKFVLNWNYWKCFIKLC